MDSILFTIASFIVALAILIAVHEFGHFWVARKLGVKVLRFSIGFGKTLWSRRGRSKRSPDLPDGEGTEYVLAAIPLGGYVKMLDEREGDVPEAQRHRAFNRQSLPVRSAIVVAGPLFNFLFAILAFWMVFMIGDSGTRAIVGEVKSGSLAAEAGFMKGDEIAAVGDQRSPTWESVIYALLSSSGDHGMVTVRVTDASGNIKQHQLNGDRLAEIIEQGDLLGSLGVVPMRPEIPPRIDHVVSGEAADQAGLRQGDLITQINGKAIESWHALVEMVRKRGGEQVDVTIERDNVPQNLKLNIAKQVADGKVTGRIGAGVMIPQGLVESYRAEVRYGPVDAFSASIGKTWDMSIFLLRTVGRMVVGKSSLNNLSGPIAIAQTAGRTASIGLMPFIKFLALVSISLGVLNLLPIPVLDGGHLFFFLIEAIRGAPLSEAAMLQGQKIGMAILLALMVVAFYVDLSRLLG